MMASGNAPGPIRVVDLGTGMPAALVCQFLQGTGAKISRFEAAAGDPFHAIYPAYQIWHAGKHTIPADADDPAIAAALATADVAIIGGEDHPDLDWSFDPADLARRYPALVILDITGYPRDSALAGRPAVDILAQTRSGLVNEQYSDRPMIYAFPAANYGAALHGLVGLFAALTEREQSGKGQIVSASLFGGAMMWCANGWFTAERPTTAFSFNIPKDPRPTIFRCSDGAFIHLVTGTPGSKSRLYQILGIDDPTVGPNESGVPVPGMPLDKYFGDIDLLTPYVAGWTSDAILKALDEAQIPAARVLEPGQCWDDPQVAHNGTIVRDPDGTRHVGHPIKTQRNDEGRMASKSAPRSGPGPLAGVRVLDLTGFVAGPYASVLLADLGAEVIKIEPIGGEPVRRQFQMFTYVNRGKRSLEIDLKSPEGTKVVHALAKTADIVLNNFRPGVAARLGVDAPTLHAINPNLVTMDLTGFGSDGPKALRPGFDMIFQAATGHEMRGAPPGEKPFWTRSSMVDFAGGLVGAAAMLAALVEGRRRGGGGTIDASLLGAGIFLLSELIQTADGAYGDIRRANRNQTGISPAQRLYRTTDGWIALAIFGATDAERLGTALNIEGVGEKPVPYWGEVEEETIEQATRQHKTAELSALLDAAKVWNEPVDRKAESTFMSSEAWRKAGSILSHVDDQYGEVRQVGPVISLSRTRIAASGACLPLGHDNRALLSELGYDGTDIARLQDSGVVGHRKA
jgi:crotonobetainyl-CoA:carnitine CoA-transferase CaiB-like acyl-CoA transferase